MSRIISVDDFFSQKKILKKQTVPLYIIQLNNYPYNNKLPGFYAELGFRHGVNLDVGNEKNLTQLVYL